MRAPDPWRKLRIDDILVIEARTGFPWPAPSLGAGAQALRKTSRAIPKICGSAGRRAMTTSSAMTRSPSVKWWYCPTPSLIGRSAADIHLRTALRHQHARRLASGPAVRGGAVAYLTGSEPAMSCCCRAPRSACPNSRPSSRSCHWPSVPVRIPDARQAADGSGRHGYGYRLRRFRNSRLRRSPSPSASSP